MKKKFFGMIFCMLFTVAAVLGIAGCGGNWTADGNFPSDVAVQNGYAGSLGAWLSEDDDGSTVYRKLYEEAKEEGFSGSYVEFLKQIGVSADETPALNRALLSVVSIQCMYAATSGGAAGAGVITSYNETTKDMTIVTNYHVVYNASTRVSHFPSKIYVWLYGTRTYANCLSAEYVGGALNYDLAVLNVHADAEVTISEDGVTEKHTNRSVLEKVTPVAARFADSDDITVGDPVYAIGNPLDGGVSLSHGVVSVDAEEIDMLGADEATEVSILTIRTDAAINHGNSGGGLFNTAGELIGIVNARSEDDAVVLGVGYAIPSNRVRCVVDNLSANEGKVNCARISCTVAVENSHAVYDETTGKTYQEEKVVVQEVVGGAGAAAGLSVGDTFVSAKLMSQDGTVKAERNITRQHYLLDLLLCVRPYDTLELVVSRDGSPVTLTLKFDQLRYFTAIE